MQGEVTEEVLQKEEPAITVYSVEDDAIFHERMGVDEDFEEDGMDTTMMVSRRVLTKTLEKKDVVIEKMETVIKELQARIKLFTDEGSATGEN